MKISFSRKTYRYLFSIWCGVILVLTSIPDITTPEDKLINYDKIFHYVAYLLFAFLFVKIHEESHIAGKLKLLLLLAIFVPVFDEVHQIPIPGRSFSWADIVADIMGFLTVYTYFRIRLTKLVRLNRL